MSEALQVFEFEQQRVRTVLIDGELWFVAKDVAEILDYEWKGGGTIRHIPDEWKGVYSVQTPSGTQSMAVLSEQGLYFFLARSDKPKALPFQKWLARDVVPSIRKTGSYSTVPQLPQDYISALKALVVSEEEKLVLAEAKAQLETKIVADAPKVEGYEIFLSADAAVSLDDLAKTLGYKPRQFRDHLKKIGVLMSNGKPYAQYANKHWFRLIQVDIGTNGHTWFVQQVLVESCGQEGIYQLLKRKPVIPNVTPSLFLRS